ncbi:hypothetical protein QCA50_005361 [Cerrena zonata]|uniref:DUF6533 domain-containing protein n=1 Tax=Cerrena zonata TaxID=2478898 RepID=A0AAW0GEY2_9APHY
MAGMTLQQELDALFEELHRTHIIAYLQLAAVTTMFCDIASTLFEEKRYIWESRFSLVKALYLCARYLGFFVVIYKFSMNVTINPTTKYQTLILDIYYSCHATIWITTLGTWIVSASVEMILVLRINALYGNRRAIKIPLIILFLANTGVELLGSLSGAITITQWLSFPGVPIMGCITTKIPPVKLNLAAWISNLVFACILFAMMLYKFITASALTHTSSLGAIVEEVKVLEPYFEIPIVWTVTVLSYSASHLILNLKASASDTARSLSFVSVGSSQVSTFRAPSRGDDVELQPKVREHI